MKILDCFAALAMTEYAETSQPHTAASLRYSAL
ncbi:hypothetical protein M2427_001306 [Bradyrhizobium sp. BR13661]|jgi:hypothetical protein|nr:hypothetical protein [Bradyrhizobium sp. BR13661]